MLACRYARYYFEDKIQKRTLFKVFGIRIDIIVNSLVSLMFKTHVICVLQAQP